MRIAVVGAGPAGLAAAEALLDADPTLEVEVRTLGHVVGGRACSHDLADGRTVEHGQHVVIGFYDEMRALLARSGVDFAQAAVSNRGRMRCFEDRDDQVHELRLGRGSIAALVDGLAYDGWTAAEKAGFAETFVRGAPDVVFGVPEALDDVCLTAWCLEHGLPASVIRTNAFRASRDAQLNGPNEISAYTQLKAIQAAGRDYDTSEMFLPAGGMSTVYWEPIVRRIEALGGAVRRLSALRRIVRSGDALQGLAFSSPIPHPLGQPWTNAYPPLDDTEEIVPVDAAIVAVPPPVLAAILSEDPELAAHPAFAGVPKIASIAPLGLHVWHKNPVSAGARTVVMGLAPPLAFVVDNRPIYRHYRDDSRYGACLHFVGQETGFEGASDEELLATALASVRRVAEFEDLDDAGVIDWQVVRNRAPHKRYWNAEPGSLRYKPFAETPLAGMFLAGDWIRSELDFPCMEGASRSGRHAARLALGHVRALRRAA